MVLGMTDEEYVPCSLCLIVVQPGCQLFFSRFHVPLLQVNERQWLSPNYENIVMTSCQDTFQYLGKGQRETQAQGDQPYRAHLYSLPKDQTKGKCNSGHKRYVKPKVHVLGKDRLGRWLRG